MKRKIILLAVALGSLMACTDDRESDLVTADQMSKGKEKDKTNTRSAEKVSFESDSIKALATGLNELTDGLDDGGDPKDVPPRRRFSSNSSNKTGNKNDSIRVSLESSKEGSDKIEDGGDPKDVPPRR